MKNSMAQVAINGNLTRMWLTTVRKGSKVIVVRYFNGARTFTKERITSRPKDCLITTSGDTFWRITGGCATSDNSAVSGSFLLPPALLADAVAALE